MTTNDKITGVTYAKMIAGGAANLCAHVQEVNDLNVFPIPDGDTGENMLLTILGGVGGGDASPENLGEAAERVSEGMLLSARGNSGVSFRSFLTAWLSALEDFLKPMPSISESPSVTVWITPTNRL